MRKKCQLEPRSSYVRDGTHHHTRTLRMNCFCSPRVSRRTVQHAHIHTHTFGTVFLVGGGRESSTIHDDDGKFHVAACRTRAPPPTTITGGYADSCAPPSRHVSTHGTAAAAPSPGYPYLVCNNVSASWS